MTPMERLKNKIAAMGGSKAVAQQLGISASYLSEVLRGNRGISTRFASIVNDQLALDGLALLKWQAHEDWKREREKQS